MENEIVEEKKGLRKMIMGGAGLSIIFISLMITASVGVIALYEYLMGII